MFNFKALLKSIGYRLMSMVFSGLIALFITQDIKMAFMIGLGDFLFKIVFYYTYEVVVEKFFYPKIEPAVIWMTGLSGAGKTTICKELEKQLTKWGNKVVLLDGDEIRTMFPSTGFDEESRKAHNKRVAYMSKLLKEQGSIVLVSLISPYESSRKEARELCENNRFFEVYISTSLEVCSDRDVKGLYAKAKSGQIKNFTGIDAPYEAPQSADISIDTLNRSVEDCAATIIRKIKL